MTSFRDSMASSSVILSGFSSDVCFLMSAGHQRTLVSAASRCVCVRACVLPLSSRATLGSLCTGRISSSTSVCLPHSALAWLIYRVDRRQRR